MVYINAFYILQPPPQVDVVEPQFVQRSRAGIAKIKRDFPHIFERPRYEQHILDACKAKSEL